MNTGMNIRVGLNENVAQMLQHIFRRYDSVNEVVLYGSRAKATNHERSDIDLVIKNSPIDRHLLGAIKLEIDSSDIPYAVDLQVFEKITNRTLLEHIQRVGIVLYKKDDLSQGL